MSLTTSRRTNANTAGNAGGLPRQKPAQAPTPPLAWSSDSETGRPTRAEAHRRRLRREYNRKYMRAWRANTDKKRRKSRNVRSGHRRAKTGELRGRTSRRLARPARALCGFCRRHPAVSQVARLQISGDTAKGFRAVRVPYCGVC